MYDFEVDLICSIPDRSRSIIVSKLNSMTLEERVDLAVSIDQGLCASLPDLPLFSGGAIRRYSRKKVSEEIERRERDLAPLRAYFASACGPPGQKWQDKSDFQKRYALSLHGKDYIRRMYGDVSG